MTLPGAHISLSSCSPWSSMCITPMGLTRRKHEGATGSCGNGCAAGQPGQAWAGPHAAAAAAAILACMRTRTSSGSPSSHRVRGMKP